MNIRLYLKEYPFFNIELHRLQTALNTLIQNKHESYCTLQAVPLTGMPSSGNISDSVSNTIQVLIDRIDKDIFYYSKKINNLLDEKALFEKAWFNATMTNEDRAIIQLKCFEHQSWRNVAGAIKYSDKQCQRLYEKAIQKLQLEVDKLCQLESPERNAI